MPTAEKVIQYKKRNLTHDLKIVPPGGWEVTIPSKGIRVSETQSTKDPMISVSFRIDKALEDENEKCVGQSVRLMIILPDEDDPTKIDFSNMQKDRLFKLLAWADLDKTLLPEKIETSEDFQPLVDALEGKKGIIWTSHRPGQMKSGEDVINVNVAFQEPGDTPPANDTGDPHDTDRPTARASSKKDNGKGNGRSRR